MAAEALAQDQVEGRGAGALGDGRVPGDVLDQLQQPVPVPVAEEPGEGAPVEGEPAAVWARAGLAGGWGDGLVCLRLCLVGVRVGVRDCVFLLVVVASLVVNEADSPLVVSHGRQRGGLTGGKRDQVLVEVSRLSRGESRRVLILATSDCEEEEGSSLGEATGRRGAVLEEDGVVQDSLERPGSHLCVGFMKRGTGLMRWLCFEGFE